jgi:arginine exporter protein ArgO
MRIENPFPRIARLRLVGTAVLCVLADILWYAAAAFGLAGMSPSWRILVAGIIPPAVGWTTLLAMEWRIARDDVRVARQQPQPERSEVLEGEAAR